MHKMSSPSIAKEICVE